MYTYISYFTVAPHKYVLNDHGYKGYKPLVSSVSCGLSIAQDYEGVLHQTQRQGAHSPHAGKPTAVKT